MRATPIQRYPETPSGSAISRRNSARQRGPGSARSAPPRARRGERVQLGARQRPRRPSTGPSASSRAAEAIDEQRAARRDEGAPTSRDRVRAHRLGQRLHGQRLEHERERLGPGARRSRAGRRRRSATAEPGWRSWRPRTARRRDVEGGHVEAQLSSGTPRRRRTRSRRRSAPRPRAVERARARPTPTSSSRGSPRSHGTSRSPRSAAA